MQIINSFLYLTSYKFDNEELRKAFKEIENKIITMSLVHQKLYQSKSLSKLSIKDFIDELINIILLSYNNKDCKIIKNIDIDDFNILFDIAIPLGLVLNEILSNTLKYAFIGKKEGIITLTLKRNKDSYVELVISDNGHGLKKDFDIKKVESLGFLTIIEIAKHQLSGDIEFISDHGLKVYIKFKDNIYKERVK